MQDEIFGPVTCVTKFETEEEVFEFLGLKYLSPEERNQ